MKRRIIFILSGLLIVGSAAFFYIDTVFLPIQFKRYLTVKAEKFLQREVSIGSIDFHPIKGFLIENITIARKDDPNRPFIQVEEIEFNLLLAPILHKQAIILPHIKIKDPYVYLARDENRIWNFSDLPALKKILKNNSSFSVLLRKLDLEGGEIYYLDKTQGEEFSETIKNIEINTTLSLNKGARFIFKAEIPKYKTLLQIKGNYALIARSLTAQVLVDNLYLARYHPLMQASRPYIGLDDGILSSADFRITYKSRELQAQGAFVVDKMNLRVGEDRHVDGTIFVPKVILTWRDKKWNAKGRIQLPSVHMTAAGDKEFRGNVAADLNLLTVFNNNMTSQGNVTIDNAYLAAGKDKYLKGNITAENASLVKGDGSIRLLGNFDVKEASFAFGRQTSLTGGLSTKDTKLVWSIDEKGNPSFDVQSGLTMSGAELILEGGGSVSGNINIEKSALLYTSEKITAEALGQLETADIQLTDSRRFQGSPYFNIFYALDPQSGNPADYKGTFHFTNAQLTGAPFVDQVSNIAGVIAVMPDHIQTGKLTFNTQQTDIQLSGSLTNFTNPGINIEASSENVRIEKVMELFPAFRKKINADLTGKAAVHASYKGPINSPSDAIIESTVRLSEATAVHKRLTDIITGITGTLDYKKDLLRWHGLKGVYRERPYVLNGELNNFSRPTIDTTVTGGRIQLTTRINVLNSAFQLTTFAGNYLNSSFDLRGDVHLFEDMDADLDLRGTFALNVRDIGTLVPSLKYPVQKLDPAGILTGEGVYKGKMQDWRNWQMTFSAASDKIILKGLSFENIFVRFTQRDLTISKLNATSRIYGGELAVTSSADLRSDEAPFKATIDLKNLDLAQLRKDRKTKNRQLAGILSLSADLQGEAEKWKKMTGKGTVDISDGHIWQWNILDGMANALLIPEFKNFVFTQAHGNFIVQNEKILTNNTHMTGQSVTLDGRGWIDFHTNLNFDINPTFSKLAIAQSGSLKKGPTSILTQTDGYLNIKLTGTLGKPNFRVEKSPMKIIGGAIGNTTGTITEVIGGIVDEIF